MKLRKCARGHEYDTKNCETCRKMRNAGQIDYLPPTPRIDPHWFLDEELEEEWRFKASFGYSDERIATDLKMNLASLQARISRNKRLAKKASQH